MFGQWKYQVSFRRGDGVAFGEEDGVSAGYMDGAAGSLTVTSTDKTGRDFRAHGRLQYTGEHYLQFAETNGYFLKCGTDAPENFLAYNEIDNTPNVEGLRKIWKDHAIDYDPDADEFLWGQKRQKGKNILGAINYLSQKGMNAFSFLTFNVDGDDKNVFPHLLKVSAEDYEQAYSEEDAEHLVIEGEEEPSYHQWEESVCHDRFDVSKLDQWEQIFCYAEMKGMFLHFKTQEEENDRKMDGGNMGPERKLYYRELIARFAHHLGLNWNLGEENQQTIEQLKEAAAFIAENDPYGHLIVFHTYPMNYDERYKPFLGSQSVLTGLSIQTSEPDFSNVHSIVKKWVKASAAAGKKWVVACDEPGDAEHSLLPDQEDPEHNNARINGLWGALMAGGCGTEWYFGYQHAHSDLTCESWRSRDLFWDQCRIALDFFKEYHVPVSEMKSMDELTRPEDDFVFALPGKVYLVYARTGGVIDLNLPDTGYHIKWYNPRTGEMKAISEVTSKLQITFHCPSQQDWLLYLDKRSH